MGLFGKLRGRRKAKKKEQSRQKKIPSEDVTNQNSESLTKSPSSISSCTNNDTSMKNKMRKLGSFRSTDVTVDQLPDLILDLEAGTEVSRARTSKALKMLFALSEHPESYNRIEMVRYDDGRIVSALLNVLRHCTNKSNEKYMALLVLNNISIPAENKQVVAIFHGAARVLSRLLCDDPSCHLIAIVLVNLSFAEPEVLQELVSRDADIGLIEALAYVLHVSSWTTEEYDSHRSALELEARIKLMPQQRLEMLIAEEEQITYDSDTLFESEREKYPETTRWCLSALKNLSRIGDSASTIQALVHPMMLNNILKYITIPDALLPHSESHGSNSSAETPVPREPVDEILNAPHLWDANSKQDAALYIVLNLCACSYSRAVMKESNAFDVVLQIINYANLLRCKKDLPTKVRSQQDLQCLKSRMAIGFLLGSEDCFGHEKMKSNSLTVAASPPESPIIMTESDAELLVELLARSLHLRGKEGTAGYSPTTMSTGQILFALCCLLTHTSNQKLMVQVAGRILNSLLMKVIAIHASGRPNATVDAKGSEYACFSLYLLSSYGFTQPFLPSWLDHKSESLSLSAKVLQSYFEMTTAPLARHCTGQLLLRLKYLVLEGEVLDIIPPDGEFLTVTDVLFEEDIMDFLSSFHLNQRIHGAKPRKDIFDRPILRRRKPKDGNAAAPWDNRASVSTFASALQAVQQMSYGSSKVRHVGGIDDIVMANNLAKSAHGQRTEAYSYMWSWEDTANEIQLNMKRRRSQSAQVEESELPSGIASNIFSRFFCGDDDTTL